MVLVLLIACGPPAIPLDRLEYLGRWVGPGHVLEIRADGQVQYTRVRGHVHRTMEGPLRAFDGDDVIVGVFFFNQRVEVDRPPHRHQGRWRIVVDGVELIRTAEPEYSIDI